MGAVHGCHMKYVALSLIFGLAAVNLPSEEYFPSPVMLLKDLIDPRIQSNLIHRAPSFRSFVYCYLLYCALLNLLIAILFKLRKGMWIMLKNEKDGTIPSVISLLLHPFLLPSTFYTYVHTELGLRLHDVPVATEVIPGWWVGGRYASSLPPSSSPPSRWTVTLDLTAEFPESCRLESDAYCLIPTWDGQPPSAEDVERGASFVAARVRDFHTSGKKGAPSVMVHCAHGRGRSCMSE